MLSDTSAGRLRFRPQLIPTLVAVPMFLALLGLGAWQILRLEEKTAINQFRAERAAAEPVDLPAVVTDLPAADFRRVRVQGRFDHAHELYVYGRSQRGNDGYYIVTPLLRDGAAPVLVNRGWVPTARKAPPTREIGQVAGPVTVTAFLRHDPRQSWLMPDNDPANNHWFWFDLPAMSKAAGIDPPVNFYLEADTTPNPGNLPVGGQTQIELPSPHLQYAITWFALALALGVIYVVWHRQAPRPKR
jgi:surfeit locus 1 family protein